MRTSYGDFTRTLPERGPPIYYGYCGRTKRFRMMDLPDYVENMQQGVSKWVNDTQAAYQQIARGSGAPQPLQAFGLTTRPDCDRDCHCECCVCDSDILLQARCGETRRVPITYENDTRRERPVTLALDKFASSGGRDLKWPAQLSEDHFTLSPCGEHTVIVTVQVRCEITRDTSKSEAAANADRVGSVDRCEVGYATLRAEGCTVRPTVIAVAVLPDDCEAYRRPCADCCC